ncbi:MAG: hypothetical protein IKW96_10380 [Ruminococcus sp.]|uniref:hypothetical protein n=1 Tax=Ruminococcus sp. TaxID=41978 RepID=UPI0025DFFEBB|nr:hypothetical protein [Ruminococcus sp.]MBR5683657.1 hypothetical protein [Ruminococcus sp.]
MNIKFISGIVAAAMTMVTLTGTGIKTIDQKFSNANLAVADMLDYVPNDTYYKPHAGFTTNTYYIAKWPCDALNSYEWGVEYDVVYYVGDSGYIYNKYGDLIVDAESCYNHYQKSSGHYRLEKTNWYNAYYGGKRIVYSY